MSKLIAYPLAGAVIVSLIVMVLALFVFGFQPSEWTEWEGRTVGIVGTALAILAAAIGYHRARKTAGE